MTSFITGFPSNSTLTGVGKYTDGLVLQVLQAHSPGQPTLRGQFRLLNQHHVVRHLLLRHLPTFELVGSENSFEGLRSTLLHQLGVKHNADILNAVLFHPKQWEVRFQSVEPPKLKPKPKFATADYPKEPLTLDESVLIVLVDIEHSGGGASRLTQIASLFYNVQGEELGNFDRKIKIDCHGLEGPNASFIPLDVQTEEPFSVVGPLFWEAVRSQLNEQRDKVLLVAHNGFSCDFRKIFIEMARYHVPHLDCPLYMCDTFQIIKKLHIPQYYDASVQDWPSRTKAGKPSFTVTAITNYILKTGPFPVGATMENFCGEAHDAMSDVKALKLIFFHEEGIWETLRDRNPAVYQGPAVSIALQQYAQEVVYNESGSGETKEQGDAGVASQGFESQTVHVCQTGHVDRHVWKCSASRQESSGSHCLPLKCLDVGCPDFHY